MKSCLLVWVRVHSTTLCRNPPTDANEESIHSKSEPVNMTELTIDHLYTPCKDRLSADFSCHM